MGTFRTRKKNNKSNQKKRKKINNTLINNRKLRDVRKLFAQKEKDYCKPNRESNFWNNNYIE